MGNFGRCVLLGSALVLGACGGGSGSDGESAGGDVSPSAVEGRWGPSSGTPSTVAGAFVFHDGLYWMFEDVVDWLGFGVVPRVVTVGSSSTANGTFTALHGRRFNTGNHGAQDVHIDARYVEQQDLSGTMNVSGGDPVSFDFDAYMPLDVQPGLSRFDHRSEEGLVSVDDYAAHGTLAFGTGGAFDGTLVSSCNFHGTLAPRPDGDGFDVSITTDAYRADADAPSVRDCTVQQYHGAALAMLGQMLIVATDAGGNALFFYSGSGPSTL